MGTSTFAGEMIPDSPTPTKILPLTDSPLPNGDGKTKGSRRMTGDVGIEVQKRHSARPELETHFLDLPNGAFLELVHQPDSATGDLGFLVWSQEATSFVDRFEHGGYIYVPLKLATTACRNVSLRLPRGVNTCSESGELFAEICSLIRSYFDLPEPSLKLVTAFAIATWFVDKLAVAPYLWISGPPGSGKTTLLRLLHCLCRRAVLIAGNIPSALFSLPASLHPTLLLDELQFSGGQHSHTLECWLRTGNARGVPVTMGGCLVDGFGAKVLCSRQPAADSALASRALHISLVPSTKILQVLDEVTLERIADDFQSRLLRFRLLHHRNFGPPALDLSLFSPRMRDIARALMSPLAVNNEDSRELFDALVIQDCNVRFDRSHEPEGQIVTALFACSHEKGTEDILVGQLAGRINATRKRVGEEADLKPRAVGAILKSLGFMTDKLSSFGRGLCLTPQVRRRIHELLRSYGFEPSKTTSRCAFCEEVFPRADQPKTATAAKKRKKDPGH